MLWKNLKFSVPTLNQFFSESFPTLRKNIFWRIWPINLKFSVFIAFKVFFWDEHRVFPVCLIWKKLQGKMVLMIFLDRVMAKSIAHRSTWFPLLPACRFVKFDTFVICSRGAGTEKWSFRSPHATEKVWQWIIALWHLLKKTW